jgi:hypothetical protein
MLINSVKQSSVVKLIVTESVNFLRISETDIPIPGSMLQQHPPSPLRLSL